MKKHYLEILADEAPEVKNAFYELADRLRECGLDTKTFELIYIAIKAAAGQSDPVHAHAATAKKAGAKREEVLGAVLMSLLTNGVDGVSACLAAAIDGYDNA